MNTADRPLPPSSWRERLWRIVLFAALVPDGRPRAGWRALLFFPVFIVLLLVMGAMFIALGGGELVAGNFELQVMLGGVWSALSAAIAAYLMLRVADRRSFRTLGLWFYPGWGRELIVGLAGGFGLLSVVVVLLWAAGQVQFTTVQLDPVSALRGLAWTLLVLLAPAAFEELMFRGYPFQRLVEGGGAFLAVFLLSVLFGLMHLDNPNATVLSTTNTVLIGILLALAYLKTQGLWLPIGLHWAWNVSLGFIYSLPVSGYVLPQKLLGVEITGPDWLSGGNYGPEGSVITTGVALLATGWLARTSRLGVSPAQARELR